MWVPYVSENPANNCGKNFNWKIKANFVYVWPEARNYLVWKNAGLKLQKKNTSPKKTRPVTMVLSYLEKCVFFLLNINKLMQFRTQKSNKYLRASRHYTKFRNMYVYSKKSNKLYVYICDA